MTGELRYHEDEDDDLYFEGNLLEEGDVQNALKKTDGSQQRASQLRSSGLEEKKRAGSLMPSSQYPNIYAQQPRLKHIGVKKGLPWLQRRETSTSKKQTTFSNA